MRPESLPAGEFPRPFFALSEKSLDCVPGTHFIIGVKEVVRERECPGWRGAAFVGGYVVLLLITVGVGMFPGLHPPQRGSQLTVEEFVDNYNAMARFRWGEVIELQTDGTFGVKTPSNTVVIDLDESEDLVLQFEESDGVLTKVSFERDISSWYTGSSVDSEGKRALLLSTMAYGWADCGPGKAYRSQKELEEFTRWGQGTLSREILGCQLTYTITPREDLREESEDDWYKHWHVEFEFVPNN